MFGSGHDVHARTRVQLSNGRELQRRIHNDRAHAMFSRVHAATHHLSRACVLSYYRRLSDHTQEEATAQGHAYAFGRKQSTYVVGRQVLQLDVARKRCLEKSIIKSNRNTLFSITHWRTVANRLKLSSAVYSFVRLHCGGRTPSCKWVERRV